VALAWRAIVSYQGTRRQLVGRLRRDELYECGMVVSCAGVG
jgi:hypothetical protein